MTVSLSLDRWDLNPYPEKQTTSPDCSENIDTTIEDGADGEIFGYGKGDPMDGEKIIRWRRKRSGKAEEIRHILKEELGMECTRKREKT